LATETVANRRLSQNIFGFDCGWTAPGMAGVMYRRYECFYRNALKNVGLDRDWQYDVNQALQIITEQ
jgi:hypothetical protein